MIPVIPVLIVAALIAGILIGTRRTRRAVRTTDGRRRHGIPRPHSRRAIAGELAAGTITPATMQTAMQVAEQTRSAPRPVSMEHPPTVAIPRIDGTLPTHPQWDTRA